MTQTVVGLFERDSEAQRAVEILQKAGFSSDSIDVARGTSTETGTTSGKDGDNGVVRFFKSLFGDNDEAERYSKLSTDKTTILSVYTGSADEARRASEIMDEAGAMDVDERSAGYRSDRQHASGSDEATISRVQEELQVGKREVEAGGVRVRSRIVEKPVEQSIRLREEHVSVSRQQVDRPVTDADLPAFQDQEIELTERAEVPVVSKESRVVEEITISKDVNERTETIHDTVRNTEVDIDDLDTKGRRDKS